MRIPRMIGFTVIGLLGVVSLAAYGLMSGSVEARQPKTESSVVDAMGNLRVPEHYRTSYQFLGSWAIASDSDKGSKQIHDVYASPGAIDAYRKNGRFPDGAVLIKEVFQATTQPMKTGIVSHVDKLQGWFVMVKESKDIHPDNKLWGDGWAWSWFNSDNPEKTTSTNFKVDCLTCHVPARSTDWIYVSGYPPLQNGAR